MILGSLQFASAKGQHLLLTNSGHVPPLGTGHFPGALGGTRCQEQPVYSIVALGASKLLHWQQIRGSYSVFKTLQHMNFWPRPGRGNLAEGIKPHPVTHENQLETRRTEVPLNREFFIPMRGLLVKCSWRRRLHERFANRIICKAWRSGCYVCWFFYKANSECKVLPSPCASLSQLSATDLANPNILS